MQKPRSHAEVYNDRWDMVVNVFTVLRDPVAATELQRRLELTPYSRTEFEACDHDQISLDPDPIERARKTVFRSFAGFGSASVNGNYSTGFRANSNRSGTTPAQDWANYPKNIKTFVDRLRGVVVENRDYSEVLEQHDATTTLHFLDPPYVHSTRNMRRGNAAYAFEFTDQDHIDMAEKVEQLQGIVIICGYESDLYTELFGKWHKVRRKHLADGAAKRTECLWMNRKAHTLF